jgi:hypothetical protein
MPTIYHYTEPLLVSSERYGELITRTGWYSTPTSPTLNQDRSPTATVVSLRDFGVDGTGNHDETTQLQNALTQAASVGGTVQMFGIHPVSNTLNIPSGVQLSSSKGVAKIKVAAGFNFPVIKLDAVEARLTGFKIVKDAGAAAGASGHGVYIVGNAKGVTLDHVQVDGAMNSFYFAGQNGAVAGVIRQMVLVRCRAMNSGQYGYWVDSVNGIELVGCSSDVSGLDGVKLRMKTFGVQMHGGYFTGAIGGDGLDSFAGGDSFSITGGVYSGNSINGITIKSDSLNLTDPSTYGYVRNITIANVIAQDNGGNGLTLHRHGSTDDATIPMLTRASVFGGLYDRNVNYGLYLLGHQISVVAPHCTENGLEGIYLMPNSVDIDIINPHVAGNSKTTAGARAGIRLDGTRVRVRGGSSIGTSVVGATSDADVAAGTQYQKYGLEIASTAVDASYDDITCLYNTTANILDSSTKAHIKEWGAAILRTGQYITIEGTRSTLAALLNVEYAMPIWIGRPGSISAVGIEVTTGVATCVGRIGIRRHIQMNAPGPLLGQVTIAADTTNSAGIETPLSVYFPYAGLYFITYTNQVAASTLRSAAQGNGFAFAGSIATAVTATPLMGYQTAATVSGVLTDTYTISNRIGAGPLVVLKGA